MRIAYYIRVATAYIGIIITMIGATMTNIQHIFWLGLFMCICDILTLDKPTRPRPR